ncbi:MAG: biopolymer transporter ExbD [Betaproteobacteria bacterium]|nr:biopolymer transporter ExbD [Betaproteobacteria bacterium]MCC6247537.1 biopolymer transporter ExbD [Rubrivivax sp.]
MSMTATEKRAARKRAGSSVDMNLVALIDIFTILIFFLLAQVGPVETLPSPKAVQLPLSTADKDPKPAVVLVVSGTEILVEGRKVADLVAVAGQKDDLIAPLKTELDQQAQRVAVRTENKKATNAITIMSDKDIPYHVLKRVMVTCAQANFGDVSFALRRKEGKDA